MSVMKIMNSIDDYETDLMNSADEALEPELSSDWQLTHAGGDRFGDHGGPMERGETFMAERMVGLGFRCWVRGMQTGDTRFFDVCSRQYISRYGVKDGLVLSTKLGTWVNSLEKMRARPLKIFEVSAPGFSYDEVVAISMIAACQHAECPALRACIYAITEASEIDMPQFAAQDFADGLIDAGQILRPECITYPLQHMAVPTMGAAN